MATTENFYTGDGSTVLFSFTFPYLETTDIKVSLDGVDTTEYSLANATTVQFNTAPTSGAAIRIYRITDDTQLAAQFYPGSAIRSQDLNDNFTQNLYVTQEANREASSAVDASTAATTTANTALSTANTALADAATAVSTANSASTAAASAVTTANTANTNASAAVTTANSANANATAALNAAAEALAYRVVANVAAIPSSPVNGDAVRVTDSTGIESFTPLSSLPGGFIGDSALTVEIYFSSSSSSWVWVRYYPTDPETRYASSADLSLVQSDISQAQSDILGLDSSKLDVTTAASTYLTQASAASSYVAQADIGVSVQAYDADTAKLDVAQSFTAQQTFKELKETVYTLTGTAIDPANGSIQLKTLSGSVTFTDALEAGQCVVLMLVNGASYTVTWPTITWVTSAGNAAPTLTAKDTLVLWKVSTTLYGAYVGSYV